MNGAACLSVGLALTCVGPWTEAAGATPPAARQNCHSEKHLTARVDPEPRLAEPAEPFVLDFAGVIFLRDGSVQRVKGFAPFELSWKEPTPGKVSSLRLAQLRVLSDVRSTVEIKSKDDSVSRVSGVLQGCEGRDRALHDPMAGLTYRVDRFSAAAGGYESIWRFVPWKDLDTAVFVGTPGIKRGPVDGRRFPGQYMYSPYTGDQLVWEDKPAAFKPDCGDCRAFMARLDAACNECPDAKTLGETLMRGITAGLKKARTDDISSQAVAKLSGTN